MLTITVTFTYSCNVSLQLHLSYLHVVYMTYLLFSYFNYAVFITKLKAKTRSFDIHNQQDKQSKSL